jgi:glyoxylase-like metal-dependent hydrolase (beta-lactamase superfamily II)
LRAIAISHPNYYSTMVEWSHAFGKVPIYLHVADEEWVMRPDSAIHFWKGDSMELGHGLSLIHCGGHFAGGTVLHWAAGAGGKGALLVGDIIQVVPDRTHLSFMWSYPGLIPLAANKVRRVAEAVESMQFDRIYGAWWDRHIEEGAKEVLARSVQRYLEALRD